MSVFSEYSSFNLIINDTLRLSKVLDAGNISDGEQLKLQQTNINIHLNRASLVMNRITLMRDILSDSQYKTIFIEATYLQEKFIHMSNMYIQLSGFIMHTFDPMSLKVENSYIDYYATMGGFVMRTYWNYPEAYVNGYVVFSNNTVVHSKERTAIYKEGVIMHAGSENMTVNYTTILIWTSLTEDKGQIEKQLTSTWMPQDDVTQISQSLNNYWSLHENPVRNRFIQFFNIHNPNYYRKLIVNYDSNTHENIFHSVYANNYIYSTYIAELWMRNNIYTNVSWLEGAAYIHIANKIIIENEIYQNSSDFGHGAYSLFEINEITVRNITLRNLNGTGSSAQYYLYFALNPGGSAYIDSIFLTDSYTGFQTGIYIEGFINHLVIQNSIFRNLKLRSGNALINTGTFKDFDISNTTFNSISNQYSEDEDNYMLIISTIDLDSAVNSIIQNISIQSSSIGFINLNSIIGTLTAPISFNLINIYYSNCYFTTNRDLIKFGNLESNEDLQFTIENIQFSNITFTKEGNLLAFEQQMLNKLIIRNSVFTDIISGFIHLEAANKQNSKVFTEVTIYNSTFVSIDSKYGSLITLNEGGILNITNWVFQKISSLDEGAIVHAGYRKTFTTIANSTFTNNTSIKGGIFTIDNESVIIK